MKKIKSLFAVILLLLTASMSMQAQTFYPDNSFGVSDCGRGYEEQANLPRQAFPMADGSVISVMGYAPTNFDGFPHFDGNALVITRFSPTGSVMWTTGRYGGQFDLNPLNADYYNGKIFVCGYEADGDFDDQSHAWLGCFDAETGANLWQVLPTPRYGQSAFAFTTAIAMKDGSGSVVVFGSEAYSEVGGGSYGWLQKYTSAGVLDNTYNAGSPSIAPGGCVFTTQFLINSYNPNSMVQVPGVLQSSGKIVVAVPFTSCSSGVKLLRFNTDGSIDNTFAGGGNYVEADASASAPPLSASEALVWSGLDMKLAAGDKLRITGTDPYFGVSLSQYDSDGNLDFDIGTGLDFQNKNFCVNLSIDPATDETYLFADPDQFGPAGLHVIRLTSTGKFDTNFQGTGQFVTAGGGGPAIGVPKIVGYVINSHRFGVDAQFGDGDDFAFLYRYDLANSLVISSVFNAPNTVMSAQVGNASCFSYQWYKDGVAVGGATGTSYTTATPGSYYVTGNNNNQSNTIVVASTNNVPTLSEWGLIALAGLMLTVGMFYIKRTVA